MRKIVAITIFSFLFAPLAWSIEKAPPKPSSIVEAGNKFCPVSGDKISGKDFVEYKGKRYNLCCKMCAGKFQKDPQKYLMAMANQEMTGKPVDSQHEHGHDHEH